MKYCFLALFCIFTGCVSAPYQPANLGLLSNTDKVAIISSVPTRIEQYEYTLKMNWSGSTESTNYRLDTASVVFDSLSRFFKSKTSASVEFDKEKSKQVMYSDVNSKNPYTPGMLSKETVDVFSTYGKEKNYRYLAFLEGEKEGNIIRGGYGNTKPFYGIGVYTENGSKTYVYASLRLNILDPLKQATAYSQKCFSFIEITNEISAINQKEKLTESEVSIVEKYIPLIINECVEQFS